MLLPNIPVVLTVPVTKIQVPFEYPEESPSLKYDIVIGFLWIPPVREPEP